MQSLWQDCRETEKGKEIGADELFFSYLAILATLATLANLVILATLANLTTLAEIKKAGLYAQPGFFSPKGLQTICELFS